VKESQKQRTDIYSWSFQKSNFSGNNGVWRY